MLSDIFRLKPLSKVLFSYTTENLNMLWQKLYICICKMCIFLILLYYINYKSQFLYYIAMD